jgi:Flp pilus assembly CpaF family ATPase
MMAARPVVRLVQERVSAALETRAASQESASGRAMTPEDRRTLTRSLIVEELRLWREEQLRDGHVPLSAAQEDEIAEDVFSAMWGFDVFDRYLRRPGLEDVVVNGSRHGFLYFNDGTSEPFELDLTHDELLRAIQRQAARAGRTERRFDLAHPRLNVRLPDGNRLHALMEVCDGISLTIRVHGHPRVTLADLRGLGTVDERLLDFLAAAVRAGLNLIICGEPHAGKTTLLRALIAALPAELRLVVIEDDAELAIGSDRSAHPNVVELEARQANIEGQGGIDMAQLVRESLRMRPDVLVLGEVRGAEAFPMLLGMTQSPRGSLCTMHSMSTEMAIERLTNYTMMGSAAVTPALANRMIAGAVDLFVQITPVAGGRRVVSSIREVAGLEGDRILTNELYTPGPDGLGVPRHPMRPSTRTRLAGAGLDMRSLAGVASA